MPIFEEWKVDIDSKGNDYHMDYEEYANGFKHAEDRLVKALADLDSIIRDEPVTAGALKHEVIAIEEQLDVAKDMIDKELSKRLGD